jgi:hypothetical protein
LYSTELSPPSASDIPRRLPENVLAIDAVGNRHAHVGQAHGGDEAVFFQDRPILGGNQVEAFATQARGFSAHVLEGHVRIENASGDALLQAPFAPDKCLSGNNSRSSETADEISASHERIIQEWRSKFCQVAQVGWFCV